MPYGADVGSTCQCDEGAKRGRWSRHPRVEAVRGCGEPQSHSHTDLKSPLLFIAPCASDSKNVGEKLFQTVFCGCLSSKRLLRLLLRFLKITCVFKKNKNQKWRKVGSPVEGHHTDDIPPEPFWNERLTCRPSTPRSLAHVPCQRGPSPAKPRCRHQSQALSVEPTAPPNAQSCLNLATECPFQKRDPVLSHQRCSAVPSPYSLSSETFISSAFLDFRCWTLLRMADRSAPYGMSLIVVCLTVSHY